MGRIGPYAEATGAVGMDTSATAMAIREEECIEKN